MVSFLNNVFSLKNLRLVSVTKENKLAHFFKLIRPITTEHPLIRLGASNDAGYLIPDDIENIRYCFSPGVSTECSFEDSLSKLGITSFMADFSVDAPPILNSHFNFLKKYVGYEHYDSFISLENWMNMYAEKDDDDMILQMDIEGSEYNVLHDTSTDYLKRFRIILIEFHQLDALFNAQAFDKIAACFYKLLKNFSIVHIHPNNCATTVKVGKFEVPKVAEFTFLRKDRIRKSSFTEFFPHVLDRPNVEHNKEIILPACFYQR